MSPKSLNELTMVIIKRYLKASKKQRTKILDEYCANSGLNRKYAITKIRDTCFKNKDPCSDGRGKKKTYSNETDILLLKIWKAYGRICGERLHPFIAEGLKKLIQFGYANPLDEVKEQLLDMSISTVKRRISHHKVIYENQKGFSTTKPGSFLKRNIEVRLSSQWVESQSGYGEVDLVAHCGGSLFGDFIFTLQYVDIHTTWTERRAVMGKGQARVFNNIMKIKEGLPFKLNGIDSDNGSEFINHHLYNYCLNNGIKFTRGRPGCSKDNAHIEQKNYPLVRKVLGYDRFDTDMHLRLINDLYDNELRLYLNFFQPSLKLKKKIRIGSKYKRTYNEAKTPYQRVLECPEISQGQKDELIALYETLDPIKLKKTIDRKIMKIINLKPKIDV